VNRLLIALAVAGCSAVDGYADLADDLVPPMECSISGDYSFVFVPDEGQSGCSSVKEIARYDLAYGPCRLTDPVGGKLDCAPGDPVDTCTSDTWTMPDGCLGFLGMYRKGD
jgi:hypothetical protein